MQILYSFTLILWAFVANLIKKHFNTLTILLINSYLLGFIDRDSFGILNKFDLNAICLILYLYLIATNFSLERLRHSIWAKYFIILLLLYVFGVFYPFLRGYSTLFWSIKEGKEYIHYLAFFAIYLSVRKESDLKWSWLYIVLLALYYGFLEIAYIFGVYKINILHYLYRQDSVLGIVKVYQPIFSIVFLALFYLLWKSIIMKDRNYFQLVFLFSAGLYTAFRSYILGSFIALGACFLTMFKRQYFFKGSSLYALIVLFTIFIFSVTISGSMSKRFTKNFDNYIFSGVREFVIQKGGSLEGRKAVNKFRWEYFNKQPWLGYGFIDKNSKLGLRIFKKYRGELTMIDTGYLDALIKFGIIGSLVFYGIFLRIVFLLIKIVKQSNSKKVKVQGAALFCFLITLLAAQVTHAGLTFSFGIVPLAIGMGLLDSKCYLQRQKVNVL